MGWMTAVLGIAGYFIGNLPSVGSTKMVGQKGSILALVS